MARTPAFPMKPPWTPELLRDVQLLVQDFLLSVFRPRALEFGGGWSTVWLNRLARTRTYEDDRKWYAETYHALHEDGAWNQSELIYSALPPGGLDLKGQNYDLALVDCVDEARHGCALLARDAVRPGGLVLIDDSHWDLMGPTLALFDGWTAATVSGMHFRKTGDRCFHQTTIFTKPEGWGK